MKITFSNSSGLILVYLYFFTKEQCIRFNNGGESDLSCKLLFDTEDEWLGISVASNNIIDDNVDPNYNDAISYSDGVWTVLFRSDKTVIREEIHSCITDLYNNKYTGIELILLEGTIPRHTYINDFLYK